jgi:hypothetical protein
MKDVPYCFGCWPTGPVTPPPCLRCGSNNSYFMSGLCARCHPHSPQGVDSCTDCYAWGATRTYKWRCKGCEHWHGHHPVGTCPVCRRTVPLNAEEGVCRLCLRQRAYIRQHLGVEVDLVEATCEGHQPFLADLIHRNGAGRRFKRKPAESPPPPIHVAGHRQLVLFEVPRDLHAGLRNGFPPPSDPGLDAALSQITREQAARYGWNKSLTERTLRGIRILLGTQDTPGAPVKASDVAVLAAIGIGAPTVLGVLSEAGLLDDDRTPTVEAWFDKRTADLAASMREELRIWFDVMRHGSSTYPRRSRAPRKPSTPNSTSRSQHFGYGHNGTSRSARSAARTSWPSCPPPAHPARPSSAASDPSFASSNHEGSSLPTPPTASVGRCTTSRRHHRLISQH